jgi:putative sigma-54 modulation protein
MKLLVRSRLIDIDETARARIVRRIHFSLGRLSMHIARVTVQILDVNVPRGGEDKVCRIEVRIPGSGPVFVEATDAALDAAVDRAADRSAQAVSRTIQRARRGAGGLDGVRAWYALFPAGTVASAGVSKA